MVHLAIGRFINLVLPFAEYSLTFFSLIDASPNPLVNKNDRDRHAPSMVGVGDKESLVQVQFPPSGPRAKTTDVLDPASEHPGIPSAQDFPPLAAPQPIAPPKNQRRGKANTATSPTIKPAIPVLPTTSGRSIPPPSDVSKVQTAQPIDETNLLDASLQGHDEVESVAKPRSAATASKLNTPSIGQPNISNGKKPLSVPGPKTLPVSLADEHKLSSHGSKPSIERQDDLDNFEIDTAKEVPSRQGEPEPSSITRDEAIEEAVPVPTPSQTLNPAKEAQGMSSTKARQSQPRTLRVLANPQHETTPRTQPESPSTYGGITPSITKKTPSRRESLTSMNQPGTPASERISDNASLTSTSLSRANSPPPSKASAPTKQATKSQQKKERQARARLVEESSKRIQGVSSKVTTEEPVQAPIVGRKKKAKKASTKANADLQAEASQPPSPKMKDEGPQDNLQPIPTVSAAENPPMEPLTEAANSQKHPKHVDKPSDEVNASQIDQQKNKLTAASILSGLQKSGDISASALDLFKGVPGLNHRIELAQNDISDIDAHPTLTESQIDQINSGEAITVELENDKRIIVLPDRFLLRGLSAAKAERFLDLRKQHIALPKSVAFSSPRYEIDRYIHALPDSNTISKLITLAKAPKNPMELDNCFVTPPTVAHSAAASMPPHWSVSPLAAAEKINNHLPAETKPRMDEAEQALMAAKKETESLEKKLNAVLKRNRRLVFGSSG